jgi:tetratricopeptide (TPR) repeat protein
MSNTGPKGGKTFDENISVLHDELSLAAKWERPSILLAIHKSKLSQEKAEKELEARLARDGHSVARIVVNPERADVAHLILATPTPDRTVFFVSNIDWGGAEDGKEAYRALNLYRELFVENRIKAVFSLTSNEATNLALHAPDFWAFRHRVVEFASARAAHKASLPAGLLVWDIPDTVDPFDNLDDKIRAREDIMSKLPRNSEALSTRVDLYYVLGHLYWLRGDPVKADASFQSGLDLALGHQLAELAWHLLNGVAVLQHEVGQYEKAVETYRKALEAAPESSALLINLSAASCMLGRNQEAITIGKRAVRVDPGDARIWNRLGYIYEAMGKVDDARTSFAEAVALAPHNAAYLESLAIAYCMIERPDEAIRHLKAARQLEPEQSARRLEIYEEGIMGNAAKAEQVLRAALSEGRMTGPEARRDPNLSLLLDPAQIEALTAS